MNAPRRIVLHVGAPKTGTTFAQDVLFRNPDRLRELGMLYPADRFDAHFLAALDLMELPWGGLEREAVGAWDRLARQVRAWSGDVVISHEILATASRQQVRRAMASLLDGPHATELHVVMSVRDLVRQIPAEWQENVKHRRILGYRAFLDVIGSPDRTGPVASWFWGVQEVPAILDRWGEQLPPEQVHVLTVPRPGAPPDLLWQRFAQAFGVDPDALDTSTTDRSNASLGVAETAFVRMVNQRVNAGVLANEHYREFTRELLAHRTLSRRADAVRLRLPDDVHAWAAALSEQWATELAESGYHVIGSLSELRADPPPDTPYVDPDDPPPDQLFDAALTSTVALLCRAGELRGEIDHLHGELAEARAERDQAWREAGLVIRGKRAFVARSDHDRAARMALAVYRRLRRREHR